jgi:hypothetical protein
MDAYDRCSNSGKKNLADSVAIYGRGRELFRPPTYTFWLQITALIEHFTLVYTEIFWVQALQTNTSNPDTSNYHGHSCNRQHAFQMITISLKTNFLWNVAKQVNLTIIQKLEMVQLFCSSLGGWRERERKRERPNFGKCFILQGKVVHFHMGRNSL